ncbi:MAG TPA: linear amide C-N hydrolase, partial [Opitutales bacterium]|nr:linear amide C-N hydrolase [Opitutales bacterium]
MIHTPLPQFLKTVLYATLALCLSQAFTHQSQACTSVQLTAADGSSVVARTMDFEVDLHSYLKLFPRGETVQSIKPDGTPGMSFTSKYASFGIMSDMSKNASYDAMNEKGLTFALQWLNAAGFPTTIPADNKAPVLEYDDFPRWILGQFATVDEVKANLDTIALWAKPRQGIPGNILTVHVLLFDAQGKGLVIEYINGKMHVHDNPVGVVTNDPCFHWHLTNLSNYIQLNGIDTRNGQFGDLKITMLNHGNGDWGTPGDMTSVSRFVRMAIQRNQTVQPANAQEAIARVSHLINNVDVVLGTVRTSAGPDAMMDSTSWTSLRDTRNSMYYIRCSSSVNFFSVDVKQLWNSKAVKETPIAVLQATGQSDVTSL